MLGIASAVSPAALDASAPVTFRPILRLFTEQLLVEDDDGRRDVECPVLSLRFDYQGHTVSPSDPGDGPWLGSRSGLCQLPRDLAAEAAAQRLLESFGAVELECVEGTAPPFDSEADYLVTLEGNRHAACAFTARAVPELERRGWEVSIDEDYPYQVISHDPQWYASVEPSESAGDWFDLELGIEAEGHRIDLVGALLELLAEMPSGTTFADLCRRPIQHRAVEVMRRRYVMLPWERLVRVLRVLAELFPDGQRREERLPLPDVLAMLVGLLDQAFSSTGEPLTWRGSDQLIARGRALASPAPWCPPPAALRATLRSYQHQGVMWLEHLRQQQAGGILADDMGLGKTLQTIALLAREKEARRLDRPALVVSPTSVVKNWERELRRFAPHLRTVLLWGKRRHGVYPGLPRSEVVLTTYPILVSDRDRLSEQEFHYVVLDEAQTVKNPRSQASRAARELSARHRLCLTGTPVENNLEELWSLFEFLMPGLLGRQQEFRVRFRQPIEREGDRSRLELLGERVRPFILRRVKEAVAPELPSKTELARPVELCGAQRDLYESIRVAAHGDVRRAIAQRGMAASSITVLDALTKLRQVCCDPRLVRVREAADVRESAKLDAFSELATTQLAAGRRLLVFSQFTQMLALIAHRLRSQDIDPLTLTGATRHRQGVIDAFEAGEADVFLISLKAGGTGLNLTSADTVVHYDPWWNAAAQAQATDRAYRIGQTKPVFVFNLIAAGSVEERMLTLQRRKQQLADGVLGQSERVAGLSLDEVEDLFAPLEDT
jgi:superfamily II DNA or RNA helicase